MVQPNRPPDGRHRQLHGESMARRKTEVVEEPESKSKAPLPVFDVQFVDDLPAPDKRRGGKGRGPSMAYFAALSLIQSEGNGAWGTVARYSTPTGATTAKRLIERGEKIVPEGKFEYDVRRLSDEAGTRCSVLYARYVGE